MGGWGLLCPGVRTIIHRDSRITYLWIKEPPRYATHTWHHASPYFPLLTLSLQISISLITRTRSILADPEQMTIPWTNVPKTPKDMLTDTFAEIPGLLVDLDDLRRSSEDAYTTREALIRRCWQLEKSWRAWLTHHQPRTNPVIASPDTVSPSQVFDSFLSAHIMVGYWATGSSCTRCSTLRRGRFSMRLRGTRRIRGCAAG